MDALDQCVASLDELLVRVRSLDLREAETRSDLEAHALVPLVLAALADAHELLQQIEAAVSSPALGIHPSGLHRLAASFFRMVDTLMAEPPRTMVIDLIAITRWELRSRGQALERLRASDTLWHVLEAIEGARRGLIKALTAIATALRALLGLDAGDDRAYRTELATSLETRCAYAELRRRLAITRPPEEHEIYARLRLVGTQITVFIGKDIYPMLRIGDRAALRQSQTRILAWLATRPRDLREGVRIWQDIAAFMDLLRKVNDRPELVQHDRQVVDEVVTLLHRPVPPQAQLLAAARSLCGRDDELDGLLASDGALELPRWQEVALRLQAQHAAGVPRSDVGEPTGELELDLELDAAFEP